MILPHVPWSPAQFDLQMWAELAGPGQSDQRRVVNVQLAPPNSVNRMLQDKTVMHRVQLP